MGWTEERLRSFIISTIRSGMRRYPPKYQSLDDAKVGKRVNPKSGRSAVFYKCNGCGEDFVKKDVQVDHIDPVVDPKLGFQGWDEYIKRMFCPASNLQVLCRTCHSKKTTIERAARKK